MEYREPKAKRPAMRAVCLVLRRFTERLVEVVVYTDAQDVVGDARTGINQRDAQPSDRVIDGSEIHIKIFELRGPIARDHTLYAAANRPAGLGRVAAAS